MKQSTIIALTAAFAVALLGTGQDAQAGDGTKIKKSSKGKTASKSTGEIKYAVRGTGAETGLAGINLYDSGLKVLKVYGNPESISAISVGGTSTTGGDGQGGPPGGFGGGGGRGPTPGGAGGRGAPSGTDAAPAPTSASILPPGADNFQIFPSDTLGNGSLWQPIVGNYGQNPGTMAPPPGKGMGGDSGNAGGGRPAQAGPPAGMGGMGGPGGGAGAGANAASESTTFTRWQYTKNGTKLAFVIDKFNRVLQIEAIGLANRNISTKLGVGFGNTFQTVMNKYAPINEPDGYDLAGNNFTIRFLTRSRVAFRLTQLGGKNPHVVTGIVVSAGKK